MKKKLDETIPGLPPEPLAKRLLYCAEMLNIWAMLTDDERRRVNERIRKRFFKEAKQR